MIPKLLRDRWKSPEGRVIAQDVMRYLVDHRRQLPEGFGIFEGRSDFRGLVLSDPVAVGRVSAGNVSATRLAGLVELRGVSWNALDLSHALLPSLRFFDSKIANCRFESAVCTDWRLWASRVEHSSFAGANLRDSAICTWHEGRSNEWRGVEFDRADLRDLLAVGGLLEGCTFVRSRMSNIEFRLVTMRDCTFAGEMKDILFEYRDLPDEPPSDVLVNVDFSAATFEDVTFRGCRFVGLNLPRSEGIYVIPDFPRVARRVLELVDVDTSTEARMLRALLTMELKLPGRDDSVEVFNRRDYLSSGGEPYADFAETLFMEAINDLAGGLSPQ